MPTRTNKSRATETLYRVWLSHGPAEPADLVWLNGLRLPEEYPVDTCLRLAEVQASRLPTEEQYEVLEQLREEALAEHRVKPNLVFARDVAGRWVETGTLKPPYVHPLTYLPRLESEPAGTPAAEASN